MISIHWICLHRLTAVWQNTQGMYNITLRHLVPPAWINAFQPPRQDTFVMMDIVLMVSKELLDLYRKVQLSINTYFGCFCQCLFISSLFQSVSFRHTNGKGKLGLLAESSAFLVRYGTVHWTLILFDELIAGCNVNTADVRRSPANFHAWNQEKRYLREDQSKAALTHWLLLDGCLNVIVTLYCSKIKVEIYLKYMYMSVCLWDTLHIRDVILY